MLAQSSWRSVAFVRLVLFAIVTTLPPPADLRAAGTGDMKIVRGRVVDEAGMPVGGARLWLPLRYQPRRVVEGTADAAGHFELKFPADWVSPRAVGSSWTIWAYAPGHGIATQSPYDVVRGKSDEEIELKLTPTSNTRFRILTPAGKPLAGAVVEPQTYRTTVGYDLVPPEMISYVSARTDADGIATLPAIRLKPLFRVQVVSEELGKQAMRVDRDLDQPLRDIRLRETGKIEGRLVGDRAEWLRGVRVALSVDNQGKWTQTQGEAEAITDEDGRFEVPTIACGGPVHMYLQLDPSLPVRPRLDDKLFIAEGEPLKLEIPLVPSPKVHGRVRAKDGKPIANAEISLGYGGFRQSDQVVTDEEGRYEGRALPGPVRVHIIGLPQGYVQLGEPWAEPYQVPAGVEEFALPTIEVVATRKLTGRLVGEKDEPLAEVQLIAGEKNRRYGFAKTDAEGRFTMDVPEGVETTIEVYTDTRGQEPVSVVQADPLVVRFTGDARERAMEAERERKPDVTLRGRVLLGGKPLAGVNLTLNRGIPVELPAPAGGRAQGMRMQKASGAVTAADGRYRLSGLKASESYSIEVTPPMAAADPTWQHQSPYAPKLPANAEGEVELPDINLRRLTQSLAGRVVDADGNPVESATVSAMLRAGQMALARNSMAAAPPWTETDKDGRFKLQQLPDEPLSLMVYMRPKEGAPIRNPAKVNVELGQQDIRILLDPMAEKE